MTTPPYYEIINTNNYYYWDSFKITLVNRRAIIPPLVSSFYIKIYLLQSN